MFLLRMLMRKRSGAGMDPLQVAMTGVRMGERFLQIGCADRALLSGLAAKVGLSGTAAVAALDAGQARRAQAIGAKVGALIEVTNIAAAGDWPFAAAAFDMVVVDDSDGSFRAFNKAGELVRQGLTSLRPGGRIEIVTPIKSAHGELDYAELLSGAGFKPVRVLAERGRLRFFEGLRPQS